jgi:hypothetical protein
MNYIRRVALRLNKIIIMKVVGETMFLFGLLRAL